MSSYSYNRDKFNYHIHGINYTKPSKKYGNIETIHPVTSLFIKNIHDYHFNNYVIEEHVNDIYTKILNDDDKIIIGNFTVIQCYDDNNNLYLIDGHHRKEALIRIMNENQDSVYIDSIYIEVKLYHVSTKDSKEVNELYEKINNVKPYMLKNKDDIVRDIMSRLNCNTAFNKGLREYQTNTVAGCFPYYNKNKFINILRQKLEKMDCIDVEKIVNDITTFNNHCASLSKCKLFSISEDTYIKKKKEYDTKFSKMLNIGPDGFYLRSKYGENWFNCI
jgi:hypothetical protein